MAFLNAVPPDRLQAILLQTKLQRDNPPLYQVLQGLIGQTNGGTGVPTSVVNLTNTTGNIPNNQIIYQAGEFVPTFGGDGGESGQSYQTNARLGRFVRINEMVVVHIFTQFTNKGTIVGNLVMKGLPFSPIGSASFASGTVGYFSNASNAGHPVKHGIMVHIPPGQSYIKFFAYDDLAVTNPTEMTTLDINNNTQCAVSVAYTTVM